MTLETNTIERRQAVVEIAETHPELFCLGLDVGASIVKSQKTERRFYTADDLTGAIGLAVDRVYSGADDFEGPTDLLSHAEEAVVLIGAQAYIKSAFEKVGA